MAHSAASAASNDSGPKKAKLLYLACKYEIGGAEEVTPPDLPKEFIKLLKETALKTHRILGCSGMSRTDMILGENGKLYVLEINTIPGMTKTSLLPQQAAKMGFNFPRLLEIMIYWAKRPPQTLDFKIDRRGVAIGDIKFYPYEELSGFCVQELSGGDDSPAGTELVLKTKTKIHPFVKINLPKKYAETVRSFLKKFVEEIEYEDSVSDAIDRIIGF